MPSKAEMSQASEASRANLDIWRLCVCWWTQSCGPSEPVTFRNLGVFVHYTCPYMASLHMSCYVACRSYNAFANSSRRTVFIIFCFTSCACLCLEKDGEEEDPWEMSGRVVTGMVQVIYHIMDRCISAGPLGGPPCWLKREFQLSMFYLFTSVCPLMAGPVIFVPCSPGVRLVSRAWDRHLPLRVLSISAPAGPRRLQASPNPVK